MPYRVDRFQNVLTDPIGAFAINRVPPSDLAPPGPSTPTNPCTPLLAALAEAVSDVIAIFDFPGLRPTYLNAAARRRLFPTHGRDAYAQTTLRDLIGVGFTAQFEAEVLVHVRVLGQWSGDCVLRDEWGCEHPCHAVFTWHGGADNGGFVSMRATTGETPPGRTRETTTDSDLLHALLQTLPDYVYFKDLRSRFIRVSLAMARRDGHADAAALIGRTDFDRFEAKEALSRYEAEQRIIRSGEPMLDQEEQVCRGEEPTIHLLTTKMPLRDRSGRVVGTFGISRDITAHKQADAERLELEQQLQLNQKLESIGRLAAGIAHEINTPSQFVTDNTRFLKDSFAQLAPVFEALRAFAGTPAAQSTEGAAVIEAIKGAEIDYLTEELPRTCEQSLEGLGRIARIVRSLKEFSHPGAPDLTPSDLNRTVENVVSVSRHEWKYVADVVTDLDPDLPAVPCIVDAFGQSVLNLVINASHAIEDAIKAGHGDHGTITIRTRREPDFALVEVQDTGTGIPESVRTRIFEPFFTTKAVGRGTGQGLAIVQKIIVHDHHGRIDFTTREGEGTTFRLRLPLVPATTGVAAPGDAEPASASPSSPPSRIAPP